jgi:hypothetical protein
MCFGILPYVIPFSWVILQNTFHDYVIFHVNKLVYRICVSSSVVLRTDCFLISILSISQSVGDVIFSYLWVILI